MTYASEEDARYSWLFEHGYGNGPVKATLQWAMPKLKPWSSIIDLGCGRASAREFLPPTKKYLGVDISSWIIADLHAKQVEKWTDETEPIFMQANLEDFQPESTYDLAICIDVLEHIPESRLANVLKNVVAAGAQIVISICSRPSCFLDKEGNNLHPTVRPVEWWNDQIADVATIVHTDRVRTFICQSWSAV